MNAPLHRGIFSWHPKRIPAHRMQHIEPTGAFISRDQIAHRIVAHMTHVDAARRVGKHLKHIVLGPGFVALSFEALTLLPDRAPFRLDFFGVVSGHGAMAP